MKDLKSPEPPIYQDTSVREQYAVKYGIIEEEKEKPKKI